MKFSIIIPCYNEGENILSLVRQISPLIKKYDIQYVLVENGSKDNSKLILEEIKNKNIKKVYVNQNKGYGYGIWEGVKASDGDYIGWIHADMQLPPKELIWFIEYILNTNRKKGLFLKGVRSNRKLFDRIFTASMSVFETILFGTKLYDIGAIPVLFSRDLVSHMKQVPYDFSIELYTYLIAKKNSFLIIRKKVKLLEREKGTSSWNKGILSKFKQSKVIIKDSIKIRKGVQVL